MELVEDIDFINNQLLAIYGCELFAGDQPKFRIVFSDDQFEKRWTSHTKDGFELLHFEVRELPKYHSYIQAKYVLERLVPVDQNNTDLTTKVGYEPAHVFMTSKGVYLPPRLDMCCVVIDSLFQATGKKNGFVKYKDPDIEPEKRAKILDDMMKELFGNETDAMDAVHYKEGIVNPAGQIEFRKDQQKDSVEKTEK